ncbi:MAG: hypothetical protein CMK89_20575 [Pseudomonadales bacterium]|nr:hypothetical protein [Pseudomonadales bacterium]RLU02526.1 MAG: hypothetical protein D9N11_08765 [Ketobacter sp.]
MSKRCCFKLAVFVGCFLAGCATTLPEGARANVLAVFLQQPNQGLFYWPSSLTWEGKRLGFSDFGQALSEGLDLEPPVLQLMREFGSAAGLSGVNILSQDEAANFSGDPYTPVVFFSSSWEFIYQRLPPNIFVNKLRMGVVAKVIPLGQILEGKGPLALRTAAWEGRCTAEAYEGDYFRQEEWEANDGELLRQGLQELQTTCGTRLAAELTSTLVELKVPGAVTVP